MIVRTAPDCHRIGGGTAVKWRSSQYRC